MADEDRTDATTEAIDETTEDTKPQGFDGIVAEDAADTAAETAEPESPEETTTTEETDADESTVGADSISDEQFAAAEKLGISHSQADVLGPDGLARVVRKLTPPDSTQTSDAPASGDATQTLVEESSGKQTGVELDPDVFDPDMKSAIDAELTRVETESAQHHTVASRQISQLQNQVHQLTVAAELKAELETKSRFDGMIDGLGESYVKEFGASTPTSTQQANRSQVRTNMDIERSGRESLGLPSRTEAQLFERALAGDDSKKPMQLAREEITSQLKTNAKKMISRPTQNKGPKLTGRQRAYRSVAAKLATMGRADDNVTTDQEDLSSLTG